MDLRKTIENSTMPCEDLNALFVKAMMHDMPVDLMVAHGMEPREVATIFASTIEDEIGDYPRVAEIHDSLLKGDCDRLIACAMGLV